MKAILVATPEPGAYGVIAGGFGRDVAVERAEKAEDCYSAAGARHYEFVFVDIRFLRAARGRGAGSGITAGIQALRRTFPSVEIVVLAPPDLIGDALQSVKEGANHYLTYPVIADELRFVRESLEETRRVQLELDYLRQRFWLPETSDLLKPSSPVMKEIMEKIRAVAPTRTTVLLTGETGTGKGVIARLIHAQSNRSAGRFIGVHCGAIPDTLLESELFGHEKGAFTGAVKRRLGKFEIAHGGTLFLDEIGTVSSSMQIKLLQVLQDRTFARVGGEEEIEADVRVIAAANEDLHLRSKAGTFRIDLFYRLNVFPIDIPPLRERPEDIAALAEGFLRRMNRSRTRVVESIHPVVLEAFQQYGWPGNIREMENLIERACILETSSVLTPESFPPDIFARGTSSAQIPLDVNRKLAEVRKEAVDAVERRYLQKVLAANRGRVLDSARAAGVSARQIHNLMTRHGLRKEDFRKIPPKS
jgi:DNA-binding NtrC family response regulator